MLKKTTHDSELPAVGQQVITACAFIHYNFGGIKKVFLCKRAETKKFLPGIYEFPGGHINFGEEIVEGLQREVYEELGMKVRVGDSFYTFAYTNPIKGSHSLEVVYFATFSDPIEKIKINSEDHATYRWFSESEIMSKAIELGKNSEDEEIKAMQKGFSLLNSHAPNFG